VPAPNPLEQQKLRSTLVFDAEGAAARLNSVLLAGLGAVYLMILGCIAILVMLMAPKGIWGLVNQRFSLSLFPIGYRVKDV
jgi:ABC-type branched-subunit amino acid transport system permease subunit